MGKSKDENEQEKTNTSLMEKLHAAFLFYYLKYSLLVFTSMVDLWLCEMENFLSVKKQLLLYYNKAQMSMMRKRK